MADDISLVVGVDYKELTGFIKTSEQSKRVIKSVAQEFARTGDQKAYMSGIMRVVMAQKSLGKEAQLTQSKIMKLGAKMKQEAVFAEQLANATNRAGTAMQQTGRRTNQLGVLMQQSGYQIGDFAIQVQSGTNYMVAFGQQATQLVGTFAMLAKSTRMIALFSGLGIALPILTAIGAYFVRAKENADSANGSFEDVRQTLQEISEIDKGLGIGSGMASNADVAINKFSAILTIVKEIQSIRLSEQLAEPLNALREEFREYEKQVQYAAISRTKAPEFNVLGFEDQSRAIQAFQLLSNIQGRTKEELQDSVIQQEMFLKGSGLLTNEVKKILASYADVVGVVEAASDAQDDLNKKTNKSYKRLDDHTKAYEKHLDQIKKANDSAEEGLYVAWQKIQLLKEEEKSGKDSVAYAELVAEQERETLRAKLEQEGVSQTLVDESLKLLETQQQVAAQIKASADQAERLKNNLEVASTFRVGGGMGEFANVAGGLEAFGGAGSFKYGGSQKFKPKKEPAVKESDLSKLQKQLDLEAALLGKTEARQRVIEALGVKFVENNPKTVAGLEAQINKTQELIKLEEQRQGLIDTVSSSMESGLMAMVEGTKSVKDAFKSMAYEIIKELYRIYVVKQITGMVTGAISGTAAVPSADGGGYTGNGPRSGGLDGKGGFMAMLHPKETVIDHTKGQQGSSGGPTIIQNFNFQANGDDSVKRIIAQAAPQIANMTKKSLLDDRRRGGTTKAVFG